MPEKDELDLLLDSALATYADPGPGSDLEDHVMAAVASAQAADTAAARARRSWLPWAVAIPVAAALLFLWLSVARRVLAPQPQQAHATRPSTPENQPASPHRPGRAPSRKRFIQAAPQTELAKTDKRTPLPKLDVFPTPQPLTAQERGLALVSAEAQPPLREAIVQAQKEDDAPVHIAAIHIPPISPPSQTQP